MILFFLLSTYLVISCWILSGESCTKGFMDYDLLVQKANQIATGLFDVIGEGDLSGNQLGSDTDWIMPSLEFTCSGTITGFLLGVDVRTETADRDEYPTIWLWNKTGETTYTRVVDSSVKIILGPSNFSADGVYQFSLSTPLQFTANQVLGIYQPHEDSVVRLYYQNYNGQDIYETGEDDEYTLDNGDIQTNRRPIIYPETSAVQCINGFIESSDETKTLAKEITSVIGYGYSEIERFFPDIGFTCDGNITHIIIGARDYSESQLPEIRFWRLSDGEEYEQTGSSYSLAYNDANDPSTTDLRWYNLSQPIQVQNGDVLGIYQPVWWDSDFFLHYQWYSGPPNYNENGNVDDNNNYPLVSVIIHPAVTTIEETTSSSLDSTSEPISSTSKLIDSTSESNGFTISSTPEKATSRSISSISRSVISTTSSDVEITTSKFLTTITSSVAFITSSPSPTQSAIQEERNTEGDSLIGALVGTISSIIIILLILIVVVSLLVLYTRMKRKRSVILQQDINGTHSNPVYQINNSFAVKTGLDIPMDNPVYGGKEMSGNGKSKEDSCESARYQPLPYEETNLIQVVRAVDYEEPVPSLKTKDNAQSNFYSEVGMVMSTNNSEMIIQQPVVNNYEAVSQPNPYNTLQFGLCVPTIAQRQQAESHYEIQDELYGQLHDLQYSRLGTAHNDMIFFTEEKIYWTPGDDTSILYEQLAKRKYREILRQQIQITGHLGSGQFGTVDKGVWNSPSGTKDVAIKTLKASAIEEEKVKFLQEAAINGQFHHPNVVKLYGVVTVGEPIMIVLELVSNGDLRGYLQTLRPVSPGELLDTSVPSRLLIFCRQIASGMRYLSTKHFVHRDLAARNILVDSNEICKIADFGMSRDLQDENYYISHAKKIPIKWTAPEALNFRKYSTSSDVWSFGAVLYEIWSLGHKPFEEKSNQECVRLVESGYRLPPPPGCPRPVYEMMIQCWHPEKSSRPTFVDLVSDLSQPDFKTETDTCLGANLDTAHNLYPELQRKYF